MTPEKLDAVLCYVDLPWCYFTTQKLSEQWGANWEDAPYEHNAGPPYHHAPGSGQPWEIVSVAISGDWLEPSDGTHNSRFSVQAINSGHIAWLRSGLFGREPLAIAAGTTLRDFIGLVRKGLGTVYVELKEDA